MGENRYLPIRFFEAWMKYIAGVHKKKDEVEKETYAYRNDILLASQRSTHIEEDLMGRLT